MEDGSSRKTYVIEPSLSSSALADNVEQNEKHGRN